MCSTRSQELSSFTLILRRQKAKKLHETCLTKRIHGGVEVLEQEEGGHDDQDQEEGVVVED